MALAPQQVTVVLVPWIDSKLIKKMTIAYYS